MYYWIGDTMKIKSKHILFTVWVVIPLLLLGGIPVSEELITGKIVKDLPTILI